MLETSGDTGVIWDTWSQRRALLRVSVTVTAALGELGPGKLCWDWGGWEREFQGLWWCRGSAGSCGVPGE